MLALYVFFSQLPSAMTEPAAVEAPASAGVTETKPADAAAPASPPEPPAKDEVKPAEPQKLAEAAPEVVEPQNALTQKFTDAEWKALKELRVSAAEFRYCAILNKKLFLGRASKHRRGRVW